MPFSGKGLTNKSERNRGERGSFDDTTSDSVCDYEMSNNSFEKGTFGLRSLDPQFLSNGGFLAEFGMRIGIYRDGLQNNGERIIQ